MTITQQIAKHFREIHFGGNWTSVNLKDALANVTWQQATTHIRSQHSIAELAFHVNYYVGAVLQVLEGGSLEAHDKFSFAVQSIESDQDWQALLEKSWFDAERFAAAVEQLPDSVLSQDLADSKYGSYYRNLHGIIEHSHYHLGQIVIIKKLL